MELMNRISSASTIDQKMVEMRVKNLELLKRHQEIEEDRQQAVRLGASTRTVTEIIKDTKTMRAATRTRTRTTQNQQIFQENQYERTRRQPARRKLENDRNDAVPQRAQRVDYNRLKHEHAQELNNSKPNNRPNTFENLKNTYAFHYQSESNNDTDGPTHAKKLVIVNNKVDRIGSGRFSQQQRVQEQSQRKREERMRRTNMHTNGHSGGTNEFHLDVPPVPIWQNGPIHVQLMSTNASGHHAGIDLVKNTTGDQMDQTTYIQSFVYPSSTSTPSFNGNPTIYFTHPSSSITAGPSSSQVPSHFHQYPSSRTFENAHHPQYQLSGFQSTSVFQSTPHQPPTSIVHTSHNHAEHEPSSTEYSSHGRSLQGYERENKSSQQRLTSRDVERLQNTHHNSSSRFNNDHRFQTRPQSFYDFSSHQQSNTNNNFIRSTNNTRYQRNHTIINNNNSTSNPSLPLSAYMKVDDSLNESDTKNHSSNNWGTSHQKRRPVQQRANHQDKHQFPLSLYDPRQYGFFNNNRRRNELNNQLNTNQTDISDTGNHHSETCHPNDIDLIEEWWEDNNTGLIETKQPSSSTNSKATNIDDSGNSSLSTSIHLKESTLDDISTNEFINPSSNISNTDTHIIESLNKLQQQLKLEEAVDERLASNNNDLTESKETKQVAEATTYDTAHFMQWAKEKFREELAVRLTAQGIQQHDSVIADDDDEDHDSRLMTENEEKIDTLESDLNEKLTIDEDLPKPNQSLAVE